MIAAMIILWPSVVGVVLFAPAVQPKDHIESMQAQSKQLCIRGLKSVSLANASRHGKFLMHYHCGLLIHQRIRTALAKASSHESNYSLWREYRERINDGAPGGQVTFLDTVERHTSRSLRNEIEVFIATEHKQPSTGVDALLRSTTSNMPVF